MNIYFGGNIPTRKLNPCFNEVRSNPAAPAPARLPPAYIYWYCCHSYNVL